MSRPGLFFSVRFLQRAVLVLAALAAAFAWLWVRACDDSRHLRQQIEKRP